MRVRKVDATGDYVFGNNQAAFWRDVPDGVGQVVESRLNLWSGQWYLDLDEGTPYETQVLGKYTEASRDAVIRARILDTPDVVEISTYDSTLDRQTRSFSVRSSIVTTFSASDARGRPVNEASVAISVRAGR